MTNEPPYNLPGRQRPLTPKPFDGQNGPFSKQSEQLTRLFDLSRCYRS